jgi:hypothetical protein
MIALVAALVAACNGEALEASAEPGESGGPSGGPTIVPTALPGGLPGDACTVVTVADVVASFGGSVEPGTPAADHTCRFALSGDLKAGRPGPGAVEVSVGVGADYFTYAQARGLFGDVVSKVDGLGSEAWYALRAVHVKVKGGQLVVAGAYPGALDAAAVRQSTLDLAKLVAGRL